MTTTQGSASEGMDEATWIRWRERAEALENEVQDLVFYDAVFRLSMAALKRWPPERLNFMYEWVVSTYARDVDVRIRRLLDRSPDSLSLRSLLDEMAQRPEIVNLGRFRAAYPPGLRDTAHLEFANLVGPGRDSLVREVVKADLEQLLSVWQRSGLQDLTNWRIAHNILNKKPSVIPTWRQVHECIAEIERIFLRYRYLLLQVDNKTLLPANLEELETAVAQFWLGEDLQDRGSLLAVLS